MLEVFQSAIGDMRPRVIQMQARPRELELWAILLQCCVNTQNDCRVHNLLVYIVGLDIDDVVEANKVPEDTD
jgi:hypothetical protein